MFAETAPLFPPGCTVVLLNGLPGDSESENTYREELQQWADLIARDAPPGRLFVLCDNPASVQLPSKLPVKALKGTRENLLQVGQDLAPATNAVVVIAWGHGGQQGRTPVLHVRGARITAADMAGMAGQLHAAESHWILLFRGSGGFGRQLAAPGRQIVTSEFETSFTSDPIGMAVLLRLVRARPTISFDEVAHQFGRATASWYGERNLARTEEPTLWSGQDKPVLLAGSDAEAEGTGPADQPRPQAHKETAAPRSAEIAAAEKPALPPELPEYWKHLGKADPAQYPDSDGVILRQRLSCALGSSPAVVTEQDRFIQVLTAEGKQLGDFDIAYSPPEEELEILECEVLRPDGTLRQLDPDAINEPREPGLGDYQPARRKFVSLPGVVPGAVLHVHYRNAWKRFPLPQISMALPLSEELPALDSTLQISVPKDAPFHFLFEHLSAPDPEVKQTAYSSGYTWHFDKVASQSKALLAPPHQNPRLLFSTFRDWADFADWYGRVSRLADEITPEIEAKAKELTRDAKTDRERVLAIYNYVSGLRYVAIPLGVNSFRPHAAAHVLENQFGDCKDKANLFNTLLHALKLPGDLVLVPRFTQAHEAIPGLAFNHAISRVKLGSDVFWVDTTDEVCRFGLLPPGDPGRRVLVIDGQSTNLTELPLADPKAHQLKLEGRIDCQCKSGGSPARLTALALGYPDYELRSTARRASEEQSAAPPLLAARFRPISGSFALAKQSFTRPAALDQDFHWNAEGSCVGLVSSLAGRTQIHSPFWIPREWDLALHQRRAPLFLNQGYPLSLEEQFELDLALAPEEPALPGICENDHGPLRWRIEWTNSGARKLIARFHAELARGELSEVDTPEFQQQLRALLTALGADATMTYPR